MLKVIAIAISIALFSEFGGCYKHGSDELVSFDGWFDIYLFDNIVGNEDHVDEFASHHKIVATIHISDQLHRPINIVLYLYLDQTNICIYTCGQTCKTKKNVTPSILDYLHRPNNNHHLLRL